MNKYMNNEQIFCINIRNTNANNNLYDLFHKVKLKKLKKQNCFLSNSDQTNISYRQSEI